MKTLQADREIAAQRLRRTLKRANMLALKLENRVEDGEERPRLHGLDETLREELRAALRYLNEAVR